MVSLALRPPVSQTCSVLFCGHISNKVPQKSSSSRLRTKQNINWSTPERSHKTCFHVSLPTFNKTSPETLQSQGSHGCTMPCVPRSAQKSSPCRRHPWCHSRQNASQEGRFSLMGWRQDWNKKSTVDFQHPKRCTSFVHMVQLWLIKFTFFKILLAMGPIKSYLKHSL